MVGGSGYLSSHNEHREWPADPIDLRFVIIRLSPNAGYFIADKFVGGVRTEVWFNKSKQNGVASEASISKYAAGPFLRYYFLDSEKHFNLFADIYYQFGKMQNPLAKDEKGPASGYSILAGSAFFFNSSVALELLAGYWQSKESIEHPTIGYSITKKGMKFSIGFQVYLSN